MWVVVVAFAFGVVVGAAGIAALTLLVERAVAGQRFAAMSLVRHPVLTCRMWLDPKYKAVIRDMRRLFDP